MNHYRITHRVKEKKSVFLSKIPFLLRLMLLLVGPLMLLSSCSSLESNAAEHESSALASPIPWNKPASWEGAGALGGMGFQGTH